MIFPLQGFRLIIYMRVSSPLSFYISHSSVSHRDNVAFFTILVIAGSWRQTSQSLRRDAGVSEPCCLFAEKRVISFSMFWYFGVCQRITYRHVNSDLVTGLEGKKALGSSPPYAPFIPSYCNTRRPICSYAGHRHFRSCFTAWLTQFYLLSSSLKRSSYFFIGFRLDRALSSPVSDTDGPACTCTLQW
jgi:hypothetical protein